MVDGRLGGKLEQRPEDLHHLGHEIRIRHVVDLEQLADHVEARFLDRGHARAARLDVDDAKLLQRLDGLPHRTPVHVETCGEIPLGGQAFAGTVATGEDLAGQAVGDGFVLGGHYWV